MDSCELPDLVPYHAQRRLRKTFGTSTMQSDDEVSSAELDDAVSAARASLADFDSSSESSKPTEGTHDQSRLDAILALANALFERYERYGSSSDLLESLSHEFQALQIIPEGHEDRPLYLHNLSISLMTAYTDEAFSAVISLDGESQDAISTAILLGYAAIEAAGSQHASLPLYCHTLSSSLTTRFKHSEGLRADVDEAIRLSRLSIHTALSSDPSDPNLAMYQSSLSNALHARYQRFGSPEDLNESIESCREAVRASDLIDYRSILGTELLSRYERIGSTQDLEEGLSLLSLAVECTPAGHPHIHKRQLNLGNALLVQYDLRGERADVSLAMLTLNEALQGGGRVSRDAALALSNCFLTLYENGDRLKGHAEQAVEYARAALSLCNSDPGSIPSALVYMSHLSGTLLTLYEVTNEEEHLKEALGLARKSVELAPEDHPERHIYLANLFISYWRQYERFHSPLDLEEAVRRGRNSIAGMSVGHPGRAKWALNLCRGLLALSQSFESSNPTLSALVEEAYGYFQQVASCPTVASLIRIEAAQQWASHSHGIGRLSTALEAYRLTLDLTSQVLWLGVELTARMQRVALFRRVAGNAVACAISSGDLPLAVEFFERGRSMLWSQMLDIRPDLHVLQAVNPSLAAKLSDTAATLEKGSMRRYLPGFTILDSDGAPSPSSLDAVTRRQREAADEWSLLLDQVRKIDGLGDFLLPPSFTRLRLAAENGIVVLLNGTEYRCDTLILLPGSNDVKLLPLDSLSYVAVEANAQKTRDLHLPLGRQHIKIGKARRKKVLDSAEDRLRQILSFCWIDIVEPVKVFLDQIDLIEACTKSASRRRIWWCPNGPFTALPIHAAGLYNESQSSSALDHFISSYAVTLSSLLPKPTAPDPPPQLLAVGVPDAPNAMPIPQVDYSFVHFACHGSQRSLEGNVLQSALRLYDGTLPIARIVQTPLPNARFVFLSACETATGDAALMDEAMHLAGGMHFAGFRGVVATLWAIHDNDGPRITREFYMKLFAGDCGDSKQWPDASMAAEALNDAVRVLRDSKVSLLRWVPFVHMGI
ncbi:hypothetical protein EW146_g1265 [Bondarzewia mesenterica]|uniref:CHAT domain-containing protein n=1 Tax=Bondarzewia mesenterica TaxID=1095465 RepID=A0A4S4MAL6_9AGAM|nr:hypothetical protein EW146_g1265 [Bondarzewia mesenterica]